MLQTFKHQHLQVYSLNSTLLKNNFVFFAKTSNPIKTTLKVTSVRSELCDLSFRHLFHIKQKDRIHQIEKLVLILIKT